MASPGRKPDFLIVGAPRCATTTMWLHLREHPQLFVPVCKEVHFFGSDLARRPSPYLVTDEAEYRALFAPAGPEQLAGECSVLYLSSRRAAREIHDYNPQLKPIIMLRNPVEVLHSYHAHLCWAAHEDIQDFAEALDAEPDRKRGRRIPKPARIPNELFYRDIVRFTPQVRRYLERFGRQRVLVIIYDDLKADPAAVYERTLKFLGVDPTYRPTIRRVNPGKTPRSRTLARVIQDPPWPLRPLAEALPKPLLFQLQTRLDRKNSRRAQRAPMGPALREKLCREFRPDVERLSRLLDRDLTHWTRFPPREGAG